jgi:hypothetical protein
MQWELADPSASHPDDSESSESTVVSLRIEGVGLRLHEASQSVYDPVVEVVVVAKLPFAFMAKEDASSTRVDESVPVRGSDRG